MKATKTLQRKEDSHEIQKSGKFFLWRRKKKQNQKDKKVMTIQRASKPCPARGACMKGKLKAMKAPLQGTEKWTE